MADRHAVVDRTAASFVQAWSAAEEQRPHSKLFDDVTSAAPDLAQSIHHEMNGSADYAIDVRHILTRPPSRA